jgi:hypothetical protein
MALGRSPAALRVFALEGAMLVAAAELFAARGPVAGAVGMTCVALGLRANEWVVTALTAHVVLGMAGGLYERSLLYDKLVHLAVSFGLARLAAGALGRLVARERLVPGALLERWVPVLAALALGTLWELFEFAADATGLVKAQRGLADTMLDLGADAGGAWLGGWTAWRRSAIDSSAASVADA